MGRKVLGASRRTSDGNWARKEDGVWIVLIYACTGFGFGLLTSTTNDNSEANTTTNNTNNSITMTTTTTITTPTPSPIPPPTRDGGVIFEAHLQTSLP